VTLELIDKEDTFEVVRDQIGAILATESANQRSLATAAGKDPELWKLRVYLERANPWEAFRDMVDTSPIVNVWFDAASYPMGHGNTVERQKSEARYNIDVYAYGQSADDGATGHIPGDEAAARSLARAIRLARNILMAAENTYLQLPRGTVWRRWPQSISTFQPQLGEQPVENIIAGRITLEVQFSEFSPQVEGDEIELISIDVNRARDGMLVAEADYEFPL